MRDKCLTKVPLAIELIHSVHGYEAAADFLTCLHSQRRIRFDATLPDRAHAGLTRTITLGPEAVEGSTLSLAQTLVHEYFHLKHQHPLHKTVSFWSGVATRTPTMLRFERPAYQSAIDFLEAAKRAHPHLATEADAEERAIRQVFESTFGVGL